MIPRTDPNYWKFENYYLFNLSQILPNEQLKLFYTKDISSINKSMHYDCINIDCDYNENITNPLYQFFISGFFYSGDIMILIEDLIGLNDLYSEISNLKDDLFSEEFLMIFYVILK